MDFKDLIKQLGDRIKNEIEKIQYELNSSRKNEVLSESEVQKFKDRIVKSDVILAPKNEWFYYIGSIIEDSRPICVHIRRNFKGAIHISDLQNILDEFCPNGIPSEEMITFETVNGKIRTTKKGEGMTKGTTVKNFEQNCGGENCRHVVKWTRFPNK